MEVGRGGGQDAAVGLEHMSLDVDGQVTQLSFQPLAVQAVQHGGLGAGEAHLYHRARWVTVGNAAASHLHGQRLHLWWGGGTIESVSQNKEPSHQGLNMSQSALTWIQ